MALKQAVAGNENRGYTATKTLYLDHTGSVVEAGDRNRVSLLVRRGGEIDIETAERHGLVAQHAAAAPPEVEEGASR